MFDTDTFNRTLFFPRPDATAPPSGAFDALVDVDDASLHLRVHVAPSARTTILFFHGNGETVADYDRAAPSFADAGASFAIVDYRGYGRSTGTPTLRTLITDAHDVLRALLTRVDTDVIVMGRSIGSACANELFGAPELHARVKGFVLESGFSLIDRLAERRSMTPPAYVEPLFDPIAKLARGAHPLLVMHGARDTLVRPDEAEAAFAAAGTPPDEKQLLLIRGRGHNDISGAPEYWRALASFIARCTS